MTDAAGEVDDAARQVSSVSSQVPETQSDRHRNKAAMSAAASHVFGTTELLEAILLSLNCVEILNTRCVCPEFRDVVDGSPSLRRKTWLDPPSTADLGFRKVSCKVVMRLCHD
jgi:hypothetical protein